MKYLKMNKKFLYILSPSFASYIQWKPIIEKIKKNNSEIEILLPKPLDYKNIIPKLKNELKFGKWKMEKTTTKKPSQKVKNGKLEN